MGKLAEKWARNANMHAQKKITVVISSAPVGTKKNVMSTHGGPPQSYFSAYGAEEITKVVKKCFGKHADAVSPPVPAPAPLAPRSPRHLTSSLCVCCGGGGGGGSQSGRCQ